MKLEIGHHVAIKNLTEEQYHAFCQKAICQGFGRGEYGLHEHYYWKHIGVDEDGALAHYDTSFTEEFPEGLLTIEQALSEEIEEEQTREQEHQDGNFTSCDDSTEILSTINRLRQARKELQSLQAEINDLEKKIADELELEF